MGGVIVRKAVYDAFMHGPEHAIEFFHGYTYSGHPLACAAALATIDLYRDERLFERSKALEPKWADAIMTLKGLPNVVDIRCVGLTGAIDLRRSPAAPAYAATARSTTRSSRRASCCARPATRSKADPAAHRQRE